MVFTACEKRKMLSHAREGMGPLTIARVLRNEGVRAGRQGINSFGPLLMLRSAQSTFDTLGK